MNKPPFWTSGSWTAFVATLVALVALVALNAAVTVTEQIATGITLALPVLVGGRSWVDLQRVKSANPPPPSSGPAT